MTKTGEAGTGIARPPTPMRVAQKERTRQRLREAATELFTLKGYAATTIDDITSAIGASRATFYLHYDGKARIVREVYEDVLMPETLDYYGRLDALGVPTEAGLRVWLDEAIGFFERHRAILAFAEEAQSVEQGLEELSAPRLLDRCAAAMPRYLSRHAEGRERQQAQLHLELLIVQLSSFARLWVDGRWPVERDLILDVLLDLWSHGLTA